jgi:hypothetical protein
MAETTGTTRPTPRRRTTAKSTDAPVAEAQSTTTAKARTTRAAKTPEPVAQAVDDAGREVYAFDLTFTRETKSYAVFTAPKGCGCVGSLYFPLGTREARVRFTGGPAA